LITMTSPTRSTWQEERVLLKELTHRINNEFASVIQVVSSKAAKSPDENVKVALAGVIEQLHSYARVHHALQMPANNDRIDASEYLRNLCQSISRSKLEDLNVELVLVEHSFQMSSERCWVMGMIVAELITNALRHAFGYQAGGKIQIECRTCGSFVECRVSDDGSDSSREYRPGTGLKIIEELAGALGAGFRFNFGESGAEALLVFPIEQGCCDDVSSPNHDANQAPHESAGGRVWG
jgi:two-component sensor histidine kinase